MSESTEREQLERVRERFTRTAEQFAQFVLSKRAGEAGRLAEMAAPRSHEAVLDVACGPGTFALAFAPRVRVVVGLDFTPAILAQARAAANAAGLKNLRFAFGDAAHLPFANGAFDIVSCGFSLHHFSDPVAAVSEFARVARPGGRVALVDFIVPTPGRSEMYNRIERARDASHTRTLEPGEVPAMLEAAGLQVHAARRIEDERSFDHWMSIAGWKRGDPAYRATRALLEATLADDSAGFHPRRVSSGTDADLAFTQTFLFVVAGK